MGSGFVAGYIYLMLPAQSANCMVNSTYEVGPFSQVNANLHHSYRALVTRQPWKAQVCGSNSGT